MQVRGITYHDRIGGFRDGTDSPRAYLEACLETISDREPQVQAWVCINERGARAAADASTERWRSGRPLSLIDGMPIGIKDNLETKDMPTQHGCRAFRGNFPKRDNALVWALRAAGAVVLGKTAMAELGGAHPPATRNPFDPGRSPGGSSSGTAAAVGCGMVPAAIGTQVLGSISRPASYCGNFALKPTQGAINRGERQATSQSSHGAHAGSLEDMWRVNAAIAHRAGGDPGHLALFGAEDCPPPQRPLVLGVVETEGWHIIEDAARLAFDEVLERLRRAGVVVLRRGQSAALEAFETSIVGAQEAGNGITAWENRWFMRSLIEADPEGVSRRAQDITAAIEGTDAELYRTRLLARERMRAAHRTLTPVVDALISLASPGVAPKFVQEDPGALQAPYPTGNPVLNVPSSVLGAPALTIPLISIGNLPLGIQLMGQPHTDARMTAIARWIVTRIEPVRMT